jgi:hypothetical protein
MAGCEVAKSGPGHPVPIFLAAKVFSTSNFCSKKIGTGWPGPDLEIRDREQQQNTN